MNVRVQISKADIDGLAKELKKMGKIVTSSNLQLYRAKKYRDYTVKMLSQGGLDLKPITEATAKIQGGSHNPEYNLGTLAKKMGVRPVGNNAAEAGYFGKDEKIPGKADYMTWTKAAILAHTGYRIPASEKLGGELGKKGAKVRAWLREEHGIYLKETTHWLHVEARPFILISYLQYMLTGEDIKATDQYIDKMMASPMSDPNKADPLKMLGAI
jgi:hypothetical protein